MATKKTNTSSMTISEKAKMVKGILQNAERTAYNNAVVSLPKALFPEAETEGEDAVRRRKFEIAAQSGTPLSTRTIERNIKRPYTVAAQSDLPYDEYSALRNFNQAGAVKALENMGIDSEIAQPSAARTQQYINDALKAYDEWKKSRPASYAQASQSGTYSDSELRDLAGKDAKTNILAQETWDRENRNSGEIDTWDNVLTNMGAVSDDYLKYIRETVIPQNISTIEQNNAALDRRIANATTADLYGSEIAGDRNRLMIDTVIDIYQGKGKTADNAEALRSVFGKDMTDAEVNAVINDIKADPDAFLEKNLIDMQQYYDQWERDERIPAYEQLSEDISSELANREAYNTLMSDAQSSPTYEQDKVFTPVDNGRATGTSADMSTLYMWLNDSDFRNKYDNANYMSMTQALDNPFWAKGYEYMTEEEIYGFNAAYAQSDEAAERYLSSLNATGVLNRRRAEAQVYFSTNLTENSPFVAKGLTFGTNVITAVQSPVQLVAAATGYETDPNSSMYDINRFNTTVRGTFNQMANEVSPVLGFVDNVLTSVADNMIAVGISKGFAGTAGLTGDAAKKWVTGMTQSIMSSNAASNSLYESLQTGDDQVTAVAKAIASGGIEALTEKYSIETLLGDTTGAWKYLAKNFLAEGSEEVASDLLNPIADKFISGITNNRTEIEREYNNYILQGYSKKEASDMVMNGFVKDLVYDFFAGGFAGGLGAGTFIATNAYQGSQIKKSGSTSKLVEIAEKMPEGSQSRKYADAVKRTGSNYATAQLYSTLMQDLDSASQDTVTSIAAGELARDLRNVGETGDSETVARNILKVYQGETLTEEERNTILNSKRGAELMDKASLVSSRDSTELKAYNEAYAAGFYGRESTQNMNQTYYQAGVKAAQVAEQKRLAAAGTGKAGTGSVSYIGTVVSDADISKKNAMKIGANTFTHLEEQQQIAASAIQDIAKATSLNFVLYEGQADDSGAITIENGKYEPMTNTLYIDLNSGKNRSGQGVIDYTIMQTVAHETTHFIARNSKSGYATLQSLVRKTLEERGQDFDELVRQKVRIAENSGVELTREGAVEEVMANASEMMLKDTKVFQQLAKQNKSLVEKVKTFVSDLLSKIRKALGKVGAQHPEAKALMEAEQYVAGLQETWDAALVEALETVKGSETEASASAEEAKFSFKDMTGQDMPVGSEAYEENRRIVANMEPLITLKGNPFAKNATKDFLTMGKEYFDSIGNVAHSPVFGDVLLNESGIRHMIAHGITNRKTALLPAVKAVIENGYVIMTDENHKGNRFDTAIVAGVVEWNGKQFYMGVALRQDEGIKNSYYFHDAVFVEKRRLTDSTQDAGGGKNASIVREGADEPSIAIILSELADYNTEFQEKFSLRDPVETNGELVAVHNIKENDLLGTLRLGGFPMPSIAIIKGKDGHTMYGDYSVVFGKEAIDPQADKANKVYGADAWTPTFPPVETEIKHDIMYNVQKEMGSLAGQVDSEYAQKAESWFGNFGGLDTTDKTMADIQDSAWNNSGMVAAYLADHGESVDILEKDVPVKRDYNTARASMYDKVLDIVPLNDIESMKARELLDTYGDQLAESIPHPFARLNTLWKDKDYDAGKRMLDFLRQAKSYENSGRDTSVQTKKVKDFDATYTAMKESIDRNDFNAWVTQKVQGAFGAQGIYNGKERFTPSGNRRSFKSLHNDLTADNVVKSMLTQEESYIPPTDAKGLMAAASSMYKSIAEIKADESRLGKISGEEYIAKIAGADNMYHDFLNAIEAWDATEIEDVGELLVKAAKQRMNASAISTLFKRNGYSKATLNAAKMAKQLIDTVQNIPTGYFEAKPQRVVDFNEVRMVIAPDTMGAELENVLEELGIPYMTYAANDEADRLAKLNGLEDVKFSPRENEHLLNGAEYRRLRSEWSNYKYRGYKYTKSQYGGIVVDFDDKLVYTDINGNPMRTLTVVTDDRWLNNDIIEQMMELEERRVDYETQQRFLESVFPEGSAHFDYREYGRGTSRNQRRAAVENSNGQVRKGNRTDLSDAETSVYDESRVKKYSLRDQTETKQFKRWFGDSEVVDSDGNPKIVYHATDAAFTVFDRDKLGSNTRTNTDSEAAARSAEVGFWFSDHDLSGDMYADNSMPVYLAMENGYRTSLDNMIDALEDVTAEDYVSDLQSEGYDGLIVQDSEFGGTSYVVFEPNQIKSATDNVGTFDPSNPDIRYSLRDQTESDLTRQYLESMEITDSMNESEKWLLGKYQRTQVEIAEKESQIAEQDELKATAATPEDRTKAENRARILRDQVKRLRNAMRTMERSDGFGGLMRRSEEVVKRYMQYSDVTQATDLSDQLNADLNSLNSQLESAIKTIQSTEGAQRAMLAKGMLNEQSLTQAGKNVRATFGTRMSGKDISNRLALAYAELYATEGEQGAKNFARVMRDLAQDVLRRSNRRYQSATLDDLRENLQGSISLTDAQKQELKNAGISQSEFKRVMSGVVNVSDNGTSLASIVSNAEYYGSGIISQLASTDSEGDMILKLYNLVSEEKAKERSFALDGMSETDSVNYTMAEIMSTSNIQLAVDQNTMDAIQTAMKQGSETNQKVVNKINAAMKNVRSAKVTGEQLWRSAANADQTARQALEYYRAIDEQRRILEEKEIVQQLKSDAVSKLREERTIREYAQKATSRMRHIRKTVKGLNDMLLHETDYKNVPEELKAYVGDVVTTFGEKFGSMVFSGKQAKELLATYEKLRNSDSSFMQAQYDEDLASTLHALNEWAEKYQQLKGSGKNRLEKAQLRILITEAVDDIVSNVKAMVKNSTETRINGRKKMFADIADSAINEMMERPDHTTYQNKIGDATTWLERAIVTGNTTPVYFFDQLGNKQFKNLFKDFQNGQEKWAFISATSKQRIQEFRHAYNYDAWSDADALTFTTQQGHEITLDKEQALWLYATWKREHSNPIAATEHLTKGGFVYEGNKGTAVKKTRLGTKAAEITTGNRIAEADMKAVYGYLTEQEKGYADAMVNYLSTEIGALGNEISMELFGIRKYKEGYYFPYATARDQRFQKSASGGNATTDDSRIKHASFTHALTKGAATTLVMGNFTDVVANHIGQMALYSSMTLPIENMNRVLNYRFATEDGGTTTMRSLVRQKYGSNTLNYMERFLRDMNGGIRGTDKSAFQKTISLFKKSAVVASLSVSLQQTSAMLRAGAMMNYKYLLQTPANYKAEYDQLMQHSGVAIVKQMGRFDTNVGQSYNEWMLTPEDSNLKLWSKARQALFLDGKDAAKNRWEALVTGLPNTMDEVAWGMLWKAVKTEQADLHPNMDVNSEDFLNMCGERFNDIAYHTQVFDSTLTRSQLMRSTNPIDQMATAFRAEPTLTLNVLYDAFFNKNIPKGERAKRRASALSAVMLSSIAAAFGSALISAWGKDDDDRTAAEKIVRTTNENFWNNLMPWYNIPYISDIVNLMQGYDVERADMSLFQDVVNGFNKVQQWRNGNTTWYRAMEEFVGSLANFLGIPAKNLMRDARRIYNMTNTRWEKPTQTGMEAALVPDSILPFLEYDTSAKTYCNRLTTAYLNGDKAKAADIETYMKTVLGKDADYIQDNVKKDVAERFKAGSITEEEGTDLLYSLYKDSDGFDKDSLFYYFDKLKDQMSGKLKKGETYSKYNDFYTAVETGKGLVPAINELTSHGTTKKAIASAITTHFKPTYVSLYKTDKKKAADLQSRLLTAYEQLGYDRSDKIKDIQKWVENDEKK